MKLLESLRAVSPRAALSVGIAHAFMLIGCLWGGLPYVFLQALLVAELILVSLATIPLYPERSLWKHILDIVKLSAGLVFVLFFVVVTYGIVSEGDSGNALAAGLGQFQQVDLSDVLWAAGYLVVHVGISVAQALGSADPRGTWAKNNLAEGGATFVSMFLIVFVAFFVAVPIVTGGEMVGVAVDADALLAGLMVVVRFFMVLVVTTISAAEMDAMASNPYVDS